jgi:hypothetical protein
MSRLAFGLALVFALVCTAGIVRADVVYQASVLENNYVPFGEDGTPGRPVPGDMLGNTITVAGTNRTLDRITIAVALNNDAGNPDPATDDYTVDLYLNDGPVDPASGLMQPGTLIGSATTTVTMPLFSQVVAFDFTGLGVVVPDTFTVIISSTHPTTTFFGTEGVPGPFSVSAPPSVGSGPNTMWYTSATAVWETNNTWAIADGATTNYMGMIVEASP